MVKEIPPLQGYLILATLICIFGGFVIGNQTIMLFGFLFLFPVTFLLIIADEVVCFAKSKIAMKKFCKNRALVVIPKPQASEVPAVFFSDYGAIPFHGMRSLINVSQGFKIFTNKYFRQYTPRKSTAEKQLCFLFTISPVSGYHKIYLKNAAFSMFKTVTAISTGQDAPVVTTGIPEVDNEYTILSKSPDEAISIAGKINPILSSLSNLFSKYSIASIDRIPTNLEIHITGGFVLARTSTKYGFNIEQLYSLLSEMQKALS